MATNFFATRGIPIPSAVWRSVRMALRLASAAGNLISLNGEKEIKIWDVATGKDLMTVSAEGGLATSILYSKDGKYLIAGQHAGASQNQGVLAIYETDSGKLKRKITDYRQPVTALAANFDGSIVAVGVGDGVVQLWQYPALVDNPSQPAYWSQQDPTGATDGLAFSPDNRTLARVGADGVKLYNLALAGSTFQVGSPRQTIPSSPSRFHCALFSKDNKTLFAGSDDGVLTMFDVETGQARANGKGTWVPSKPWPSTLLEVSLRRPATTTRPAYGILTLSYKHAISSATRARFGPQLSARTAGASCRPARIEPSEFGR